MIRRTSKQYLVDSALFAFTMIAMVGVGIAIVIMVVEIRRPHQPYPITITQKVVVSTENQTTQKTCQAIIAETEYSIRQIRIDNPDFFARVSVGQTVWVKPRMDSVWIWVSPGVRSSSASRWIGSANLLLR